MHFDGTFRLIGNIDPQPLLNVIDSWGEEAWHEYLHRQQKFEPHRHTYTIPLMFDEDGRHTEPTLWPRFEETRPHLEPLLGQIVEHNAAALGDVSKGYFIRIILTRLSPGAFITPHRDRGGTTLRSHRYHVALRTNDQVEFGIESETRHLAAGEIWEINNRKLHAVRNLSDQRRIHIILDYVVPGEEVQDPDGLVVC